MKVLEEITEWKSNTPNHTYFVSEGRDRMFGYVPLSTGVPVTFSKPIRFETRGRRFRAVDNRWNFAVTATVNPTWTVEGSRGNQYQVEKTETGLTCTCPGFAFRGKCRHVTEIQNKLSKNA